MYFFCSKHLHTLTILILQLQSCLSQTSLSKSPTASFSPTSSPVPSVTLPRRGEWYIDNTGEATEKHVSSGIMLISLPFNTSNRDHGALVFAGNDCVTPFSTSTNNSNFFEVYTTKPISSQPDGFIQFNTTLKVNITALKNTRYWNAFTDVTPGGWVEVCLETYLSFFTDTFLLGDNRAAEEQKVDFKNNILNISISLTTDINLGSSSSNSLSSEEQTTNKKNISQRSLPYRITALTSLIILAIINIGFAIFDRQRTERKYTLFPTAETTNRAEMVDIDFPVHLCDSESDVNMEMSLG